MSPVELTAPGKQLPEGGFVTVRHVPLFVSHEAVLSDGRRVQFDWRLLSAIVRNCNRRIEQTGDYAAVTIGHTKGPGDNPPVVGFAGPFYLGVLGERIAIFADIHLYPEYRDVLRRYPRRSPEFILKENLEETHFDPIALLGGEPPRLDLGLTLLYSAVVNGQTVERYAVMPGASNTYVPEHVSKREEYGPMNDDLLKAVIEALEQLDWVQWVKRKMSEELAQAREAEVEEVEESNEEAYQEQPSERIDPEKAKQILKEGQVRGHQLTEAQRRMFGAAAGRERDSSAEPRESYSAMAKRIEELQARLEAAEAERVNAERYARLVSLRQFYAFDLSREMERCRWPKMGHEQFEDHLRCIEENYRRIPIGERLPMIATPPAPGETREQYSEDDRRRARELVLRQREKGVELSFEEALEQVTGRKVK